LVWKKFNLAQPCSSRGKFLFSNPSDKHNMDSIQVWFTKTKKHAGDAKVYIVLNSSNFQAKKCYFRAHVERTRIFACNLLFEEVFSSQCFIRCHLLKVYITIFMNCNSITAIVCSFTFVNLLPMRDSNPDLYIWSRSHDHYATTLMFVISLFDENVDFWGELYIQTKNENVCWCNRSQKIAPVLKASFLVGLKPTICPNQRGHWWPLCSLVNTTFMIANVWAYMLN
jgi:hypothetical protein